jgi:hypothetical protein
VSILISIEIYILWSTDSSYVYYDCRGATVGERGPWRGCLLV